MAHTNRFRLAFKGKGDVDVSARLEALGYQLQEHLGQGSYSKVRKAHSNKLNQLVAIKIIDQRTATRTYLENFLPRELDIIKACKHVNVVKMYESVEIGSKMCIVCEYARGGDLLHKIKLVKRIPETSARFIFRQLIEAVRYLHHLNIVHRDLKCENVLFDGNDNVKLADFGFARYMKPDQLSSTFCGSRGYAPPEVLRGEPYSGGARDIWSCGIILYTMVTGLLPYDDRRPRLQVEQQMKHQIPYHRSVTNLITPQVKELISFILDPSASKRPSTQKMLNTVWLRGTKWYMRKHGGMNLRTGTVRRKTATPTKPPSRNQTRTQISRPPTTNPSKPTHNPIKPSWKTHTQISRPPTTNPSKPTHNPIKPSWKTHTQISRPPTTNPSKPTHNPIKPSWKTHTQISRPPTTNPSKPTHNPIKPSWKTHTQISRPPTTNRASPKPAPK